MYDIYIPVWTRSTVAGSRSSVNNLYHIGLGTHSLSERQEYLHCSRRAGIHYRFFDNRWGKFRRHAEKLDTLNCLKRSGRCKNKRDSNLKCRVCPQRAVVCFARTAQQRANRQAVTQSQSILSKHNTILRHSALSGAK
jgi:hypothetical protein